MKIENVISWVLRITATIILWQTLYFKFTAHPESVELFTKLGVEPWGRIGTGVIELFIGILLIIPSTAFLGASLGTGTISGAILSHLTIIGIASKNDGGLLFGLAITVFICCTVIMILHKKQGISLYEKVVQKFVKA